MHSHLAGSGSPDLAQTLWASAVVAALVSGVVSLVTAWMSARLQTTREESAWQRTTRVDVYVATLDAFQQTVNSAMQLALDLFVWKIANATASKQEAEEPDAVHALGTSLEQAEQAFIASRTRAVVVGSTLIVELLDEMSSLVYKVGTSARKGSDTGSDEWHSWRAKASDLRLAFANEARRSLGFDALPDWPEFETTLRGSRPPGTEGARG